jgi:chromosome segregation ATPase
MASKMRVKKSYLIIALLLSVLLLGGCANKAEKLTELQQSQLQLQQQVQIKKVEAAEVMKSAQKYNRLTDKYQNLVRKQIDVVNDLKKSYDELSGSNTKEVVVVESKLMKATQNSVKLQKKLKRYSQKAKLNMEKAQELEKEAQVAEETVKNTEKQIVEIKQEQRVKVESNDE